MRVGQKWKVVEKGVDDGDDKQAEGVDQHNE